MLHQAFSKYSSSLSEVSEKQQLSVSNKSEDEAGNAEFEENASKPEDRGQEVILHRFLNGFDQS